MRLLTETEQIHELERTTRRMNEVRALRAALENEWDALVQRRREILSARRARESHL